ncbi:MAG: hypothetical protein K1X79_05390 [Oligoflexia bacterium]|nr:hypothetical protein [Oligoflexia bacterium]
MSKKVSAVKKAPITLASVVMVFTKSSHHGLALIEAELVTIEGLTFLRGIQVTGKEWHRMERKRTLIPFDHVASIVEFEYEDDLWREPQPKHIRLPDEENQYTPLTSHTQPDAQGQGAHIGGRNSGGDGSFHRGGRKRHRHNNRNRHHGGNQGRFPSSGGFSQGE